MVEDGRMLEFEIEYNGGTTTKALVVGGMIKKERIISTGTGHGNKLMGGWRDIFGGGYGDGMKVATKDGLPSRKSAKLASKMKPSSKSRKTMRIGGAKSGIGKGMMSKWKGSDSSQPGIRQFLEKLKPIINFQGGNSHGSQPDS